MKKFFGKILLVTIPVFLLLISVNYFGDAAKIFGNGFEKKIAKLIFSNQNVTNIQNYDERILQRELIKKMKQPPEVVVIGSSRTMLINSEYFPNQTFFNNSVSGATIEDLIAIYQIYLENDVIPRKIILGIDPWMFNEYNGKSRWKSIQDFYLKFNSKRIQTFSKFEILKLKQLVSLSYFQNSLQNLPGISTTANMPIPVRQKMNENRTILKDGSMVYGAAYRDASPREIEYKINQYKSQKIYGIDNFKSISANSWKDFNNLIQSMENNNIQIQVFLSPYAPQVFDLFRREYAIVLQTEIKLKDYLDKKNIKIFGSYNPYLFSLDQSYFYDGMHMNENGVEVILSD